MSITVKQTAGIFAVWISDTTEFLRGTYDQSDDFCPYF